MSGFELNKIAASVLLASIIAVLVGTIVDILYHPVSNSQHRGYQVAVSAEPATSESGASTSQEFQIDIKELMRTASADAGKQLITRCQACHNFDKGGANKIGPDLWEIVGKAKASHEGFSYSTAMQKAGGNWDYDSLAKFLHKPSAFIPGTKMTFAGLSKPQDIANVIAYLRTLSDNPSPLP